MMGRQDLGPHKLEEKGPSCLQVMKPIVKDGVEAHSANLRDIMPCSSNLGRGHLGVVLS